MGLCYETQAKSKQWFLYESIRNNYFQWDGAELMLLTHSWGWYEEATDAGSARLLYVRLQHSPRTRSEI